MSTKREHHHPASMAARARLTMTLLVLALTAVAVSGCGGSGAPGGQLSSRLLSVADLPNGWSSAPTSASAVKLSNTPCLSGVAQKREGWSYRVAGFVEGKTIPNLGEVLATGAQVGPVWQRLGAALAGCRSATVVLGTTKLSAAVRRLAFPRVADSSSAYAWTFRVAGIPIRSDLVLFQTGRYAGYVSYSDIGAPPTSTVQAFVRAAVAKAQTGSTAPVPGGVSIASAPVQIAHTRLGTVGYREVGNGPPLVLITGFSGTMEGWDPRFVNALAQRHRVIIFDNAGIGKTERLPVPLTIDSMGDQTSALLDTLGIGRADVLGWSMGSLIAQALAVRHPNQVRRLILLASFPGNGTTLRPSRAELNAFESGAPQSVMAALFPADQTAAQNAYLAAISSYPPAASPPADVLSAQKHAIDVWWSGADPAGRRAATIAAPTLVADGTVDRLDPSANSHKLAKLIPGAKLQLYPGAGHAFLSQDLAQFLAQVESFLRSPG